MKKESQEPAGAEHGLRQVGPLLLQLQAVSSASSSDGLGGGFLVGVLARVLLL